MKECFKLKTILLILISLGLSSSLALGSDSMDPCDADILKLGQDRVKMENDGEDGDYLLEVNSKEWLSRAQLCDFSSSYYEIEPLNDGDLEHFKFRMRHVSYIDQKDINKISLYTEWMTEDQLKEFISKLRSLSPTKEVTLGKIKAKRYFQMVTLKSRKHEVVIASIESQLPQRIESCKAEMKSQEKYDPEDPYFCDMASFDVKLNWAYNEFLSLTVSESMEGAQFPMTTTSVVKFDGVKATQIKDLGDMNSENDLLVALKKDWVIRNSNN